VTYVLDFTPVFVVVTGFFSNYKSELAVKPLLAFVGWVNYFRGNKNFKRLVYDICDI